MLKKGKDPKPGLISYLGSQAVLKCFGSGTLRRSGMLEEALVRTWGAELYRIYKLSLNFFMGL
jgi:hypothetical protein